MLREAVVPLTRLVQLPGRGITRVWECAGPDGAETLVLIHGVAGTAELNWGMVFAPLARHFRVVAADLRGHGDGIGLRARFRLEDCATMSLRWPGSSISPGLPPWGIRWAA